MKVIPMSILRSEGELISGNNLGDERKLIASEKHLGVVRES